MTTINSWSGGLEERPAVALEVLGDAVRMRKQLHPGDDRRPFPLGVRQMLEESIELSPNEHTEELHARALG